MESTMELTVIDKSIEEFKKGSAILLANKTRAEKALKVGSNILVQWNEAYVIEEASARKEALAAVDKRSNDFLANCGKAKTEMEESRKAITQLMDLIKKQFTEQENSIDPKKAEIGMRIQDNRNKYAKDQLEEQDRIRKDAERKAAIGKEEAEIRAYIKNQISQKLIDYLAKKKEAVTNAFNAITLDTIEEKSVSLAGMATGFPTAKLGEIVTYTDARYSLIDFTRYNTIKTDEHTNFDFNSFYAEYSRQLQELKQSLIDRLESKREELLENKRRADEQEKLRKAEEDRKAEMAKANEAEMLRLQQEQKKADEEKQRLAEEQKKADDEKRQREQDEAIRQKKENEEAQHKAAEAAELEKAAGTAMALFGEAATVVNEAPEARTGLEIIVKNPAGWVEIFTYWFQKQGIKLSVDEIGGKKLESMKTFCEKEANKSGEKIDSKNLEYKQAVKAVNRKK